MQWWDGAAWGPIDATQPATPQPRAVLVRQARQKTNVTAYVLAILLGTVGAHRFYLRKPGTAWAMLLITLAGLPFRLDNHPGSALIGYGSLLVICIWVIVDLVFIPETVREINRTNSL